MMTTYTPTINCKTNPEGYITDYPFSAVKHKEPAVGDISVKLDNLPATATVVFELEKVINLQSYSSFTIETGSQSNFLMPNEQVYTSRASIDGTIPGKMVYVSVNQPLIVKFKSVIVPASEEHVRLKFKGESILHYRLRI